MIVNEIERKWVFGVGVCLEKEDEFRVNLKKKKKKLDIFFKSNPCGLSVLDGDMYTSHVINLSG